MAKILHIFPDSLFIESYINLISNDKKNTHQFILTDIGANVSLDVKNYPKYKFDKLSTFKLFDFIKLNKYLKEYDYDLLIIHSGYLNYLLLSFINKKELLNKTILSLWGGSDSKKFEVSEGSFLLKLLGKIYEFLRKGLYKNLFGIASIIPDDFNSIKELYELKCKHYDSIYPLIPNLLNSFKDKNNESYKIQVCHSGSMECNTLETLKILEKFKNENILVYASLSYGNQEYIDKVSEMGKKIFGDKFIPNYNIVPSDKYAEYISQLDVLINNSNVQQGLGNIHLALCSGVKVYLNGEGKNFNLFKEAGSIVYDIETIKNQKINDFIEIDDKSKKINYDKNIKQFDTKYALERWQKIFGGSKDE